ncbi:MAG: prepilin-type N-terminal cleavage/methylation domain-containing protein [Patescibacteria group bacterium]
MFKHINHRGGFTLIELLIVIAIIAILAGVAFVSLDPLSRLADARDASRWTDVTALLSAIKIDQVDNGGYYIYGVNNFGSPAAATAADTNYMISNATTTTGCNASACSAVTAAANCVNLSGLTTEGYLGTLPVSPNGTGSWSQTLTGYYMSRNTNGSITISACESEGGTSVLVNR